MPLTFDPPQIADAAPPAQAIRIIRGCAADLSTLSSHHYRTTSPVAVEHILSAVDTNTGELLGVLAVSRPPLNDSWRTRAWPHLFPSHLTRHERAHHLNTHVRIISRVIVIPSRRSLSLARDLVSTYLSQPLTTCTEALAAMGDLVPFFQRAGMRAIPLPTPRRDLFLLRSLSASGFTPLDLAGLDHLSSPLPSSLHAALISWARAHRATRSLTNPLSIGLKAANSLLSPRSAFVSP